MNVLHRGVSRSLQIRVGARPTGGGVCQPRPLAPVHLAGAMILLAGCRSSEVAGTVIVNMADNVFSPLETRVPVGGSVLFRNMGLTPHNAVGVDGSWSTARTLGTDAMRTGQMAEITFDRAGIYRYYCSFHAAPDGGHGMVGVVVVGRTDSATVRAHTGRLTPVAHPSGVTRRVPEEYPNLQTAVDAAAPGDLVLLAAGVYREEVVVTTPSLTIRGASRNGSVLDGEFTRGNGIMVFADAVAIENLTARRYTLNGFFWHGVRGYRASYVTAVNNGDYGLYVFDSVNGLIEHAYASGSPDAGYYVGQCYPCRVVLTHVTAEYNSSGYSGTNSGGETYIIQSVFVHNRANGIVPNTYDIELLPPERETTIVGNVIAHNGPPRQGRQASFALRGNGVKILGGNDNVVERNRIFGHANHGVLVIAQRDRHYWPATGNIVRGNVIQQSGRADLGVSGLGNLGNCFEGNVHASSMPWGLEQTQSCRGRRLPVVGDIGPLLGQFARVSAVFAGKEGDPRGSWWKTQPEPAPLPDLPDGAAAPVRPPVSPFDEFPLALNRVSLPPSSTHPIVHQTGDP